MTGPDDLLVRLAQAVATTPLEHALSERPCLACRDLAGAVLESASRGEAL